MRRRRGVLLAVLALLSLPLVVAFLEARAFELRNRNNRRVVSSGEEREYLLHVPESHDAGRATPLVISMHGAGGWPAQQRDISGWNALADERDFIVAYPSALEGPGLRVWRLGSDAGLAKEVRFIEDLIDDVGATYAIDPARIYANGLSAGGGMAFALSCALPDRIAAIGTVAAARVVSWDRCANPGPVPMIAFHGTADTIVPYEGGTTWIGDIEFPDVEEWTALWARRNGCRGGPVETAVAGDVRRRSYADCAPGAGVTLFTVVGGGHTWPGGLPLPEWFLGPTSRGVDATRVMWEFFAQPAAGSAGGPASPAG